MSTRSTSNSTLLFLTRQPAWEIPVKLKQSIRTDIYTSRGGLEQRQNRQTRCKFSLQYTAILTRTEAADRLTRGASEIRSPLIIPFWTERGETISEIVADVVSTDREGDADWFTAGDYIFLSDPDLGQQFRQILSVAGAALTLEPDIEGLAYPAGSTVWPCRPCVRDVTGAMFTAAAEDSQEEPLSFLTL